ncbi:hypothetical protein MPER_12318 [Moniliophthora perniciosa FA553]|nr:hypothetical protein MPER_12318 [Moniliophthora perniciosa FA553]
MSKVQNYHSQQSSLALDTHVPSFDVEVVVGVEFNVEVVVGVEFNVVVVVEVGVGFDVERCLHQWKLNRSTSEDVTSY